MESRLAETTTGPRIHFFRLAESAGNAGEVTFHPAEITLTARGRAQAQRIADHYSGRPTLIVVSPYIRTHQTAAPLIARFPDVPVEQWPIQEFTYLEPESCIGSSLADRLPRVQRYWTSASPDERDGPTAESFSDLIRRAGQFRTRLEALPVGTHAAVFSHGQFLQALRLLVHFPTLHHSGMKQAFQLLDQTSPFQNGAHLEGVIFERQLALLERLSATFIRIALGD